jgi:hypothetical protein
MLVKNIFIDLEAEWDDEHNESEGEEEEEEYRPTRVTCLPARRHDLTEATARIEVNTTSGGSTSAPHSPYVPRKCMYLFTVNGKF